MRKVMIGTPAHDGRLDVWYTDSLIRTIRLCDQNGIAVVPIFMSFDSLVQRARNDIVSLAIKTEVDDLLFIDSDEKWEPEWALALLRHEVDCVGAAVRRKSEGTESYNVRSPSVTIPIDAQTGLLLAGVGAGFLRLTRKALLAVWEQSEEYTEDKGTEGRMVFNVRVLDGRLVGEDVALQVKLQEVGVQMYVDPSFTVSHIGPKEFSGDFPAYLARLQERAA